MKLSRFFYIPGGGVFGGPSAPPPPPPLPPVPTREDPVVLEAAEKERQARLRRAGRSANILTTPQGVLAEPEAQPSASELGS